MYETYTTTASHGDEWDNSENIRNILLLRQQKANLLGFNTYADYAVDPYMAKTPKAAEDLLMSLFRPAIKKVDEEVADMLMLPPTVTPPSSRLATITTMPRR